MTDLANDKVFCNLCGTIHDWHNTLKWNWWGKWYDFCSRCSAQIASVGKMMKQLPVLDEVKVRTKEYDEKAQRVADMVARQLLLKAQSGGKSIEEMIKLSNNALRESAKELGCLIDKEGKLYHLKIEEYKEN